MASSLMLMFTQVWLFSGLEHQALWGKNRDLTTLRLKCYFWVLLRICISLPDPAYDFGNSGYQEMKAEVTEISASHVFHEGSHNFTGGVLLELLESSIIAFKQIKI